MHGKDFSIIWKQANTSNYIKAVKNGVLWQLLR